MKFEEAKEKVLAYLNARKMGGIFAGPKDSPQIIKQTKIKPHLVAKALRALRQEGLATYSREAGWCLK